MTLTHITLAAAALLACASGSAMAQANPSANFTGLGVGVSIASSENKLDLQAVVSGTMEGTDSAAELLASYGFNMGSQWVGTVGMAVGLKSTSFGTYVGTTSNSYAKTKQHIALSFAPGLRIGSDGLLFAKLAFHQASINYTSSAGFDDTKTHAGTGVGLGYAYAMSPRLELRGEIEAVTYGSEQVGTSNTTPKQNTLALGLIYKF